MTVLFGNLALLIKDKISTGEFEGLENAFQIIEESVAAENETLKMAGKC